MMKKVTKWGIALLAVAALAAGAWWWLKPKNEINYLTEPVVRTNIAQTVSATGEISAAQLVDVGAQASGQIKKLHVTLGQQVKKGDLIAEIDSTSQLNNLNTNKAKLDTYQAQLVSAEIALRSADKKYQREQALWKEDATSREALEDAQDAFAAAKASVAELKSSIRQTQIAINTAEADLGYTRITAPMDGTVVAIPVEEGQTVNANQTTPTIVQVADLSTMLNKMQIAEGDVNKVKAGMKLTFTTLSQPDNVREATLESIDPGLTTMSQGSYTTSTDTTDSAIYYYARSLVPNKDNVLHIGMTTENTIIINQAEKVLAVPKLAVKQRGGKQYVRVLGENNQPQEKEITTGLSDNMNTEVKSGLGEGESVIISEAAAGETSDSVGRGMGRPPM
ncbi:efflux RND transporter periplasmic adaptor subunit [Uruburuella suis]|uniref:Efflux RND transporter periplasmic adaptor subunit n=2 Tax=Uruburuella suis TaxID=252130 RepID=A0AAE9GWD0_9NEIS|nr:efflux RND transporter periplasmic adaptor subunit [Uruburuella suis]TCP06056.1 macrolide-specific efflux system membrane fusion protein [Uruburuella suis]UOO78970.1 efflux RND transporter periplasmic adaptor subunit [Uruburuella suis]